MWPSAHISATHSILAPSSTVVAILVIPDILQDSVLLPEWQQIHLSPPVLKEREQAGWHRAEDSRLAADLWLNRNKYLP